MARTRRPGFSFIELVVILAIILLLLAFLIPATQKVREAAARTQTINNLKQMGLAAHGINDIYKRLPPGYGHNFGPIAGPPRANATAANTPIPRTVHVHLMPFIEQDNLYKLFAASPSVHNPASRDTAWVTTERAPYVARDTTVNVFHHVVPPFQSPSDFTAGDYKGVQNIAANFRIFCNNTLPPAPTIRNLSDNRSMAKWPAAKQPEYTQARGHGPMSVANSGLFNQALPGTMGVNTMGVTPWEGSAMAPRPVSAFDGAATIPRAFNIDGTSNVIMFATRYAVCGTKTFGSGGFAPSVPTADTNIGSANAETGLVDAPIPLIPEGGGSFYWAPPFDTRGAFFGHAGANTKAHGKQVTSTPAPAAALDLNRPTFQLAPTQTNCSPLPSTFAHAFGTGGLQVCLADASCRTINPSISVRTWNLAIQPNDGQVLPQDWNN